MRFKNFALTTKVVLLLSLISIVAIAGSIFLIEQNKLTSSSYRFLIASKLEARKNLLMADRQIVLVQRSIIQNIWAQTDADNAKYLAETQKGEADFRTAMTEAAKADSDIADELKVLVRRFEATIQGSCAKAIEMGNAATTLEGDGKAYLEMTTNCEPQLTALVDDLSASVGRIIVTSEKQAAELSDNATTMALIGISAVISGVIVALVIAIVVMRVAIVRPIRAIVDAMAIMTGGNLSVSVAGTERGDEIGTIARGLETFRAGLSETEEMRRLHETETRASTERAARRSAEAESFINRMRDVASGFTRASKEVSEAARNLSATAEETSRQAQAVSGAAEEASSNVQTVAASTEEMTASIREIGTQVRSAAEISEVAGQEAARTEVEVRALSESANKIGEVVALISSIASQTNLLALNATIEAARAGEMGRGFAIVAHEVKQLAAQTAKATDEIGARIGDIQQATGRTVDLIDRIVGTIGKIRSISTTIMSAVEEQGAATGEIAHNTQRAAEGTETVTSNISGVGRAAEMTGAASTQLMSLSSELSSQATGLQQEVSGFVERLRA